MIFRSPCKEFVCGAFAGGLVRVGTSLVSYVSGVVDNSFSCLSRSSMLTLGGGVVLISSSAGVCHSVGLRHLVSHLSANCLALAVTPAATYGFGYVCYCRSNVTPLSTGTGLGLLRSAVSFIGLFGGAGFLHIA